MRVAIPLVLTVLCAGALLLHRSTSRPAPETLVAESKQAAARWSATQRPSKSQVAAPAVLIPSEQCHEFNAFVVVELNEIQQMGHPPPFGTAPLMEVLRSGDCTRENPSVQVLLGWMEAAKATGTTPRSNER